MQKHLNFPVQQQQPCHGQSHGDRILSHFTLTTVLELGFHYYMYWAAATRLLDWIIAWISRCTGGPIKVDVLTSLSLAKRITAADNRTRPSFPFLLPRLVSSLWSMVALRNGKAIRRQNRRVQSTVETDGSDKGIYGNFVLHKDTVEVMKMIDASPFHSFQF